MPDWLSLPADLLLLIGGIITGWFVSKANASFVGIQTMVAILVLSAFVASIVCGQSLAEFFRLASRAGGIVAARSGGPETKASREQSDSDSPGGRALASGMQPRDW